jgi:hypothetical protein
VDVILKTDLYGTAVLMEEVGKVIAEGGSGIIISSQSGHRLGALPQEQSDALAMTPTEELLALPSSMRLQIRSRPINIPSAAMY